jgi:hypothetical protein
MSKEDGLVVVIPSYAERHDPATEQPVPIRGVVRDSAISTSFRVLQPSRSASIQWTNSART